MVALGSLGAGLGVTERRGRARDRRGATGLDPRRSLGGAAAGSPLTWRLSGHAVVLSVVGGITSVVWGRAMQRIEKATTSDEAVFEEVTTARWS
jgi:hypothetical protein